MAFKQSNFQQLQEKLDREAHQRQLDEEERLQHIEYVTKHDFYTENHVRNTLYRTHVNPDSVGTECCLTIGRV